MDVITIGSKFKYLKDFLTRNAEDQENYFFQPSKIKGVILLVLSCRYIWNNWLVGNGKRNMDLLFQSVKRQKLIYIYHVSRNSSENIQ